MVIFHKMKDNGFKLTKEISKRYSAQTIMDADPELLANTSAQVETQLHSLEWAAAGKGPHVNAHKTEYKCFNQRGDISTLKFSETCRQVHLPRKQCLLNRDRHQHTISKGMDSHRWAIFPSSSHSDTAVRMHHTDAN